MKVLQRYCDELVVVKFLSRQNTSLGNQVRGQILGGDTVPSLFTTLSRVHRVFIEGNSSSSVFLMLRTLL